MVLKFCQVGKYLQNSWKILRNGYKSTFMEYCVKSTINTRGILPILSIISFAPFDRLSI